MGSIRARLESISEELADLALDRLREAVSGDTDGGADAGAGAAAAERRLTRARRAVDKAAALLADRPAHDED